MPVSYWTRNLISRRTALRSVAVAGGGLATLSLVGCGGGGKRATGTTGNAETGQKIDSTKGKPGGTFKYISATYPARLTIVDQVYAYYFAGFTHSSLLGFQWGQDGVAYDAYDKIEPDLAQAMPEQPDQITYIYKLRPGAKFHNGRTVTSEDVKYSYERYATLQNGPYRTQYGNWYERMETPDPQTVVLKTKFPYADTIEATAGNTDGFILAKEWEEGPDAESKMMGSGPFMMTAATPGLTATFKKNPDYYLKPYPYFDEIDIFYTSDVVKRISDFTTKQVHMPWIVYPEERDQLKQARPDAKFMEVKPYSGSGIFMRADRPPFNDKRVRQALSMGLDRKKINGVVAKGEGREDQFFNIMYKGIFGTREVAELGDAKKYWQYDVAEAKKLLSAAGFTSPIESQMIHWDGSVIGQWLPDIATLTEASWREAGLANLKDVQQLVPAYSGTTGIGNYEGMVVSIQSGTGSGLQRGTRIRDRVYWGPNGEHSAPGNLGYINQPELSTLAQKQIGQLNDEERKGTFRQMESILAEEQYFITHNTNSQTWFFDPSLVNAKMAADQGSRRYAMRWWFA